MAYTALLFHPIDTSFDVVQTQMRVLQTLSDCKQIVVCVDTSSMEQILKTQIVKTTLVTAQTGSYDDLIRCLNAVRQEEVIVITDSEAITSLQMDTLYQHLQTYPAIRACDGVEGYDTRLLVFSLKHALEHGIVIESCAQIVADLTDTPIQVL